jgi:hypothetical protein
MEGNEMARKTATKKRASKPPPFPDITPIDLDAWFAEQGAKPIEDIDKFIAKISDAWPEGEDVYEFLDAIYRSCRGRPYPRNR